jgi:hypothetical protein
MTAAVIALGAVSWLVLLLLCLALARAAALGDLLAAERERLTTSGSALSGGKTRSHRQ